MRAVYSERLCVETRPYEGIPELLDALRSRAIPVGILSNKPHALTVRLAREVLGAWEFAAVQGESPPLPRKPDPTSALSIASRLDLSPAEVLYVGDTPTDMQTAQAAGMCAVGVAWGFRSPDILREAAAAHLLSFPLDLLPLLDE
jgi:phosphoglycolate phosphatase